MVQFTTPSKYVNKSSQLHQGGSTLPISLLSSLFSRNIQEDTNWSQKNVPWRQFVKLQVMTRVSI